MNREFNKYDLENETTQREARYLAVVRGVNDPYDLRAYHDSAEMDEDLQVEFGDLAGERVIICFRIDRRWRYEYEKSRPSLTPVPMKKREETDTKNVKNTNSPRKKKEVVRKDDNTYPKPIGNQSSSDAVSKMGDVSQEDPRDPYGED